MIRYIVCLIVGYFMGTIPTGYLIGKKLKHIDIRNYGSGNTGTTNALRTMGAKDGGLTLLGDMGKCILAILLMRYIYRNEPIEPMMISLTTGLGVILGHDYPCWLHFKGGKGIAATGGIYFFMGWKTFAVGVVGFFLPLSITRYVSLSSLIVSTILPVSVIVSRHSDPEFVPMLVISLLIMALAYYQHRANIVRLLNGTERKLGEKVEVKPEDTSHS